MDAMTLSAPEVTRDGVTTLLECEVRVPGRGRRRLWLRTTGPDVPAVNDPFVALGLLPAMKLGVPLVSEGPVSRSLLEQALPAVQRVHAIWGEDTRHPQRGRFTVIEVQAPYAEDPARGTGTGVFFSGGVDSGFSLLEARDAITDLIFIHDFETVFPEEPRRAALAGAERVAAAFGKRLIQVETNAKEVLGDIVSWHHYHGSLLIGCALPQQGRLGTIHIPSSIDVGRIVPWGSHPLLDPCWSTAATTFVHDRLDVTRFEKVAAVAHERVLLENLRVCWAPHQNCGFCSKCVRTAFALQALGQFERGLPFDRPPVTARELARLDLRNEGVGRQFQHIADHLAAEGRAPDLVRAVRIARTGRYHSGVGKLFRGDLPGRVRRRLSSAVRRSATPR